LIIAGAITPEVWVNYDNIRNYLTAYLIIILPPSSGKGMVGQVIKVMNKINDCITEEHKRKMDTYKEQYARYKEAKKAGNYIPEPIKPIRNQILVPGNITSAKLIQMLAEADGKQTLLMCETEMDAFGIAAKSDHGSQNSAILRQAFHYESVSKAIKQDDEVLNIKNPKLSGIFAGTSNQVGKYYEVMKMVLYQDS